MASYGKTLKDLLIYLKSNKTVINGHSGLKNWRTIRNNLNNGEQKVYNLNFLGDSISEGLKAGATGADLDLKGFVGLIRTAIHARYGNKESGFTPVLYHATDYQPPWSFTTTQPTATSQIGPYGYSWKTSTTGATASLTFTGTGITLMVAKGPSVGTFTYSIDGSDPVTVDTYAASLNYAVLIPISGLTSGQHTIILTKTNDGKNIYMHGAYPTNNETSGIRVNNISKRSIKVNSSVYAGALPGEIDVWNPALTIITFTANDYSMQTGAETFKTQLDMLVARCKQYGDVAVAALGLNPTTYSPPLTDYTNASRSVALKYNALFVDMNKILGNDWTVAKNRGFYNGDVHPIELGHSQISDVWLKLLGFN